MAARALTAAFLILMMLSMGLELGGEKLDKAGKRHKRIYLAIGLGFNLVILPLFALGLTHLFRASDEVAIAFLLLAASPGGRFAPQIGKIAGADLGLSVEITLFLAKLVSLTAPVTASLMLRTHHLEVRELPFILQLLVLQMLPYVVGRQLRKHRPEWAARLKRPLEIAVWIVLGVLAAIILWRVHGLEALGRMRGWWPAFVFAVTAPWLGALIGGRQAGTRRAISISADARDVALASLLASLGFSGRVQAGTFAVWFVMLIFNLALAGFMSKRPRPQRAMHPIHTATVTGGSP